MLLHSLFFLLVDRVPFCGSAQPLAYGFRVEDDLPYRQMGVGDMQKGHQSPGANYVNSSPLSLIDLRKTSPSSGQLVSSGGQDLIF